MNAENTFESHRSRLFGLSYRLLGSRSDAEDVVQDTWLRWQQADRTGIRDPEAWLVTAATRLGIDRLRAARTQREHYTGPWLPPPSEIDESPSPEQSAEVAEQVSLAFLAVLERLGPEERAAFLLKEAFDYDYAQIAPLLGQSEANCRQMVHRARERVQAGRPRFDVPRENHRRLLERTAALVSSHQSEFFNRTRLLLEAVAGSPDVGAAPTPDTAPHPVHKKAQRA